MKSNYLSCFDNLARLQTASANFNALGATRNGGAYSLKVWLEATASAIVSVTYAITELRTFVADITAFRHLSYSLGIEILRESKDETLARTAYVPSNPFCEGADLCSIL